MFSFIYYLEYFFFVFNGKTNYLCMIILKIQESFKNFNISKKCIEIWKKYQLFKKKNQHMILDQLSVGQKKIIAVLKNHFW